MSFRSKIEVDFKTWKKMAIAKKKVNAIMLLMKMLMANLTGRIYYEKENVNLNCISFYNAFELHHATNTGTCRRF